MKYITYLVLPLIALFFVSGCKPPHHPAHPDYRIHKPSIKYKPSKKSLQKMVKSLQGRPYVWAEEGPSTFDCSGFTYYMYGSMGIEIPRVARDQAKEGERIDPKNLKYGDLIFFDTDRKPKGNITHVGMYLGNGWFTHASTKNYEVVYSNLNTTAYYQQRLRVCRRYLPQEHQEVRGKEVKPWEKKELDTTTPAPVVPDNQIEIPPATYPSDSTGYYYVQVGSFLRNPTPSLLTKIKEAGYAYKIIQFPIDGKQISKLLIGPYQEKSQALKLLGQVQANIKKDAFIAEIR